MGSGIKWADPTIIPAQENLNSYEFNIMLGVQVAGNSARQSVIMHNFLTLSGLL